MKATLIRATGQRVEVQVPPPAPGTVTYPHPSDPLRLERFELESGGGPPSEMIYRQSDR